MKKLLQQTLKAMPVKFTSNEFINQVLIQGVSEFSIKNNIIINFLQGCNEIQAKYFRQDGINCSVWVKIIQL
jgi:hypothetical protein